jgi:hypothetical protein
VISFESPFINGEPQQEKNDISLSAKESYEYPPFVSKAEESTVVGLKEA